MNDYDRAVYDQTVQGYKTQRALTFFIVLGIVLIFGGAYLNVNISNAKYQVEYTKRVQSTTERVNTCLEEGHTPLECRQLITKVGRS